MPVSPRRRRRTPAPFLTGLGLVLGLSLISPSNARAWILCPECNPSVREIGNQCDDCGRSASDGRPRIGLILLAFPDKDRAIVWAGPDTLCSLMSPAGVLADDPKSGRRVPWSEIAFYLPQDGVLQTKDGTVYESDHLVSGGGNPWCLHAPRIPARLLIRPWVEHEWVYTPEGETVALDHARVLATSYLDLQKGKREWARRFVGREPLHPFLSEEDRKALSRPPEPIEKAEPVIPDVPGSVLKGRVLVDILVGTDGKPLCVVALQPEASRKSLQLAAVEAAYAWRFKPARRGRRPMPAWFPVPFQFGPG